MARAARFHAAAPVLEARVLRCRVSHVERVCVIAHG
jgi:hypothetical protein